MEYSSSISLETCAYSLKFYGFMVLWLYGSANEHTPRKEPLSRSYFHLFSVWFTWLRWGGPTLYLGDGERHDIMLVVGLKLYLESPFFTR